jgi:cytidylate kinase
MYTVKARDERDRTRDVSPLLAGDSREIDTSDKTPDAVFEEVRALVADRTA